MIVKIIENLIKQYPDAKCSLNFSNPLELLIAVILSAQSTDAIINKITPKLFDKFKSPHDYIVADITLLELYIHSSGFYKTKARNIKKACQYIEELYNGTVPNTMEELITLPGVGRKTANVVLLNAFNICVGIAVDTHAKRIANRVGLSDNIDPVKIEFDLLSVIPREYWPKMNHLFVTHGRNSCTAKKPKCNTCCIKDFCTKYNNSTFSSKF